MNLCFVILLGLSLCGLNEHLTIEKRVIGGEEAPPDKYRWAVSIKGDVDELRTSGACGASILKTKGKIQWLVTAAHCFYPKGMRKRYDLTNATLWHVRVGLMKVDFLYDKHQTKSGINDKMESQKPNKLVLFFKEAFENLFNKKKPVSTTTGDIHVKKIIIHPLYKPERLEYDIALMKLIDPLPIDQLKGVNTVQLPDIPRGSKWPKVNSECIVVGWGCTKAAGTPNPTAKLAKLKIWDNEKCKEAFRVPIDLNRYSEFCAGYLRKRYGLCPGDSGSGLVCKHRGTWKLAGVVSAAHSIQPGQFPALFTRVSYFNTWIKRMMWIY